MAIKLEVTFQVSPKLAKALKDIKKPIDKETASEVGEVVVAEMKRLIATGQSPIKGAGRFPKYKDPDKYPGKQKAKTPVNLKLGGELLDSLQHKPVTDPFGYAAEISYPDGLSEDKEKGHRKGTNGQPKRPSLPSKSGEDFVQVIKTKVTKVIRDRILSVLKGKG